MSETLTADEAKYFETAGGEAPQVPAAASETPPQDAAPAAAPEHEGAPPEPVQQPEKPGTLTPEQHAAVVAERERRKAAEKTAREAEIRAAQMEARLQERLQMIQQAMPQPVQPATEPPPDFSRDPEGWIKSNFQQVQRELQEYRQFQQQQIQMAQQQRQLAELQNWGRVQESEFAQQTPDYGEAANHLRLSRDKELIELGITDPLQRQQMLAQDVLQLTLAARQTGANVAERIYNLAKMRGYTGAKPTVPPITAPPAAQAGTSPDLATIARGQAMATGLGTAGAAPPPKLTADALARMSDAEFAKIMSTDEGRALLGA